MVAEPGRAVRWALALLFGAELMAEPGSPTSPVTAAIGAGGMIDTKAYGKLRTFDGKEESWATCSFVARSYFGLLRALDTYLSTAEGQTSVMALSELTERAQEGWRALVEAYQPDLGGRHTSMLMGIISVDADFLESLERWEVLIRWYQTVDVVSGATKIVVLMKYAPAALRGALRTNASFMGSDYERVNKFMLTGGQKPMDVGAIDDKGRKGKGKDGRGKGVPERLPLLAR
eukprot:s2127_g7.t1